MMLQVADGPAWAWIMLNLLPIQPDLQYSVLVSQSFRSRLQIINDTVDFLLEHQQQQQQRQQQRLRQQQAQGREEEHEHEQTPEEPIPSASEWLRVAFQVDVKGYSSLFFSFALLDLFIYLSYQSTIKRRKSEKASYFIFVIYHMWCVLYFDKG
jgi:TolA-binding protein